MIAAITGRLGTGKTAFLAWIAKNEFEEGRKIKSTMWLDLPHEPLFHPFQLATIEDCVVIGDEFHEWVSSVGSQRKEQIALSHIYRKFRKKDVDCYASSQRFMNLHIRYRELCNVQFRMRRFPAGGKKVPVKFFQAYPCPPYGHVPMEPPIRFYPKDCYQYFDTNRDIYCFEDPRANQEILEFLAKHSVREYFAGKLEETEIDELIRED